MNKSNRKIFLLNLLHKLKEDDIFALASQLSYSMLLSFFPFLIFLFTLAGYSSIKSSDVLEFFKNFLPINVQELVRSTVIEIFDYKRKNLFLSIIITLWIASKGFNAVIKGLNKAYHKRECRPYLKLRLLSILSTIIIAFLIILSLVLLVLGDVIQNKLNVIFYLPKVFYIFWSFLRYLFTVFFIFFIFAFLYKITPCRKSTTLEVLPGTLFTTIGWIITSTIFSFYINNIVNYSKLYGSIGAVIALMLWLFLTSVIILIGGEINSLVAKN